MKFLLALDIGTTSVKAGLFQQNGRCLATALQEYALISTSSDKTELEPSSYWSAACNTIRQIIAQSDIKPEDVRGLAVSSQGETTIVLDADDKPLRNAIVWLDNRAIQQANKLKEELGNDVYERTGIPDVIPTWPACKILWIKENEPQIFDRAAKFVLVQDYLVQRMCGQFVTDGSISCTTLFYDITTHDWWPKSLQAIGIDASKLPTLLPVGAVAGNLTPSAAAELGLTTQTKVVLGGMDQAVGAIGAGNAGMGIISETTGSALTIQATINDPMIDKTKQTPVYVHCIPNMYLFVPVCPTAGMAFKWFKDQFCGEETAQAELEKTSAYEYLNHLAERVPPGSDGLIMLPHLMGAFSPESNPAARGVFSGFTLHHGRGHFIRAIQEGVAFMLRRNLELIERSGVEISEIRTTGGGSRGKLWNQIKADVCNRPFETLENKDTALVGDAILAGIACGVFESTTEGMKTMVQLKEKILPGKNATVYEEAYQRYCKLDYCMANYFKQNY